MEVHTFLGGRFNTSRGLLQQAGSYMPLTESTLLLQAFQPITFPLQMS